MRREYVTQKRFLKNFLTPLLKENTLIVLHFELIEHLVNPFNFNCAINALLVSGGVNFFTTPNGDGFDNVAVGYNKTRLLAHSIFPPMHLNPLSCLTMNN